VLPKDPVLEPNYAWLGMRVRFYAHTAIAYVYNRSKVIRPIKMFECENSEVAFPLFIYGLSL